MSAAPVGVVVMAYGTPRTPDDVEAYYTHIRRGRPPTEEQLADLRRRYDALGGVSPLAQRTEAQRVGLATALGDGYRVVLGQKHAPPFIEDAVDELADGGVEQVVGLVLAPHFSAASVGEYQARLAERAAERGLAAAGIESWHTEPAYLDFLAGAVTEALAGLPEGTKVLFTAHSLPERVLAGDPYPDQLAESAAAVAARVGLPPWAGWGLAWQSAGRTPEPWRGPDVLDVLRELAATGRCPGVLVCAQGFVADHLEVLYDLDVEAAGLAGQLGLPFARTRSLNDDPEVLAALARRCEAAEPVLAPSSGRPAGP